MLRRRVRHRRRERGIRPRRDVAGFAEAGGRLTAELMVRRLAAGGRRIRTRGPTSNGRAPGGHLGYHERLDLNLSGFAYRVGAADGPTAEPFAGAGPAVRIRFPPAASLP